MRLRFASMTVGLAAGITGTVVLACAAGGYFYSRHHFNTQLEMARATALREGELIRAALEHQMVENDRTLISRMVATFASQPRVERLVVFDRNGVPRYTSGPARAGEDLRIESPTCQSCHHLPPEQRARSRVIESRSATLLRTVVPIPNREACYRCHDRSHKMNGMLMLDYDASEIRAAMASDLRWMVIGTGAIALLLAGAIAAVIRIFVLRRLQRFETTARQIAAGDLNRRVSAEGSDTLAWLAREFNAMADSVTGLVSEVRAERERLETVINSIDDGIVVLSAERRILAANDAFLRRTGHSRGAVVGCSCCDVHPGPCAVDDCPTLCCLESGAPQIRIAERRTPDGDVAWEEIHASPVRNGSGNLAQVVEVWRDISERRAAEARLAESHRLASLGLLASGFSHEMNTPLATVLTCVEGILRELPAGENGALDRDRISENASIAREQILRCRNVTQHFLRLSRGQQSSGDIVDVQAAIAAAARLVEPAARRQSVDLVVESGADRLHVRTDEAELQHTVINLLLNAVQACRPGGHVSIGARSAGGVHIVIADDGCGIAPEDRKRIFEPFFSLRKNGTGLGLFLSLNFVRRWGGDISVESTVGRGSVFDVVFPDAIQPAEGAAHS
jgi:PAS domain S-box-containing protein